MAVLYGDLHVDEKYAGILEPNLYHNSVFAAGKTFTDKYQIGPAGGIFVRKLKTTPVEVGKPGRDFSDEKAADDLIPIVLNNNYQKSKKIYGVQAAAVQTPLANEHLSIATQECGEGWNQSGIACLITEGTASDKTTAITKSNVKEQLLSERASVVKAKGKADVVICHPDFYAKVLEAAGEQFTPQLNEYMNKNAQVGTWLGFTFIEASGLAEGTTAPKYYDHTGTLKTVELADLALVDFIMYNHEALSIITNFDTARIVDSENFSGSKAQVEMNSGFRVTSDVQVRIRKHAA